MPDPLFNTVKLIRYITAGDFALAAFEIVFALFIVYYLIEEVIEIKVLRLDYFRSFWNIIDLFVIVVSIATLSFNIFLIFRVETLLKGLLAEPEKFADFTYLSVTSQTFQKLAAFTGWARQSSLSGLILNNNFFTHKWWLNWSKQDSRFRSIPHLT